MNRMYTTLHLAPMIAALLLATAGCAVEGNHALGAETRAVSPFTAIDSTNGVQVSLTVDRDHRGEVELDLTAESNLLDLIDTHVGGDTLYVSVAPVIAHLPLELMATVSDIDSARATDGSRLVVDGVSTSVLSARASDGGRITASGSADELDVRADDAGSVDLLTVTATAARAELADGGRASLCVTDRVSGSVTNGARLVVDCGGDASSVRRTNGGSVQ